GRRPGLFPRGDQALADGVHPALLRQPVQALRPPQRPQGARRRLPLAPRRLAHAGRRDGQGLARRDRAGRAGELRPGTDPGDWARGLGPGTDAGGWARGLTPGAELEAGEGRERDAVTFSCSRTHVRVHMSPRAVKPRPAPALPRPGTGRGTGLAPGMGHRLAPGTGRPGPGGRDGETRTRRPGPRTHFFLVWDAFLRRHESWTGYSS